jgi:hypothetical protein
MQSATHAATRHRALHVLDSAAEPLANKISVTAAILSL